MHNGHGGQPLFEAPHFDQELDLVWCLLQKSIQGIMSKFFFKKDELYRQDLATEAKDFRDILKITYCINKIRHMKSLRRRINMKSFALLESKRLMISYHYFFPRVLEVIAVNRILFSDLHLVCG